MRAWATLAETATTQTIAPCAAGGLAVSISRLRGFQSLSSDWVLTPRDKDAEALQVIYDPEKVTYRTLLEFFYKMHDPTTANRQGPDTGSQYRSAIFYHNAEQEKEAREITKQVNEKWWKGGVVTEILPAGQWWDAEQYHQLYLDNNPGGYECPSHFLRSFPPLAD
jgi:peptide-methionine (S)-S-oxide reductase